MSQLCRCLVVGRERAGWLGVAVAVEDHLHPSVAAPLAQRFAEAFERLGHPVGDCGGLGRANDRVEQRRRREIRDSETVTYQVVALAQLGLEAVDCRDDLLPRGLGGLRTACPVAQSGVRTGVGDASSAEARGNRRRNARRDLLQEIGVATRFMEGEPAGVGAEFLVEELLELERPAALLGIGGIQRRLRDALLQGGDDRRRVGDPSAV